MRAAQRFGRARRIAVVSMFAGSLLATLLPGPPAAAGGVEKWISADATFTRNGQTYTIEIYAGDGSENDYFSFTVTDRRNPDGPTNLVQRQTKSFFMGTDVVEISADGKNGFIKKANLPGDNGGINIRFRSAGDLESKCGGDLKTRRVDIYKPEDGGRFNLKTGNSVFGAVDNMPQFGRTHRATTESCGGQNPPGRCKKARSLSGDGPVGGGRRMGFYAVKVGRDNHADLNIFMDYPSNGNVNRFADLIGTIPAGKLGVDSSLDDGTLEGGFPFTDGTLKIRRQGSVNPNPWTNCNAERQIRETFATGHVTGASDFVVHLIGEADFRVNENMDGHLYKRESRRR